MARDPDNPDWTKAKTQPLDAADKLKVARARLALTQEGMADLLQVPVTSLRNWEQRRTKPDALAQRLIDLLFRDPNGMRRRLKQIAA